MKKKRLMGFLSLLSCATLLSGCDLPGPLQTAVDWAGDHIVSPVKDLINGGSSDKKEEQKTDPKVDPVVDPVLVSISVSGAKTSYTVGDAFVKPTVMATYDSGSPKDVTSSATFSGYDMSKAGSYTVTVSYGGKTASYSIVVSAPLPPEPEVSISLKELPEYGLVGDELDLDEYVELEGASDYAIEVAVDSKALVSVEGHVLSFVAEGEVEFTVSAGGKSASGALVSVRESRLAFAEYVDGVERNYTIGVIDEVQTAGADTEDESDDEYGYDYVDFLYHGDNYLLSYSSWDEDEETGEAIPGGFLKFSEDDSDAFYFTLAYDEEENESVVVGEKTSSLLLDYYNGPLGLDFLDGSKFEYVPYQEIDEESGEVIYEMDQYVIYDEDAMAFAENSLLMPYGCIDGSTGNYPINCVEFTLEYSYDEETEEVYALMVFYAYTTTLQGQPYLWSIYELYPEVTHELLDEFCVPENKPEGTDYWYYFDENEHHGLDEFFLSPTSNVGPNGLIQISYGWVDDEGNAIDCPSDATTGNLFAYMPVGSEMYVMSENSIWLVDDDFNPVRGKMAVTSEGEEPVTTVYNIFPAESESGYFAEEADEGVWEGANAFTALASRENFAGGAIGAVQDIYEEVPAEEEGQDPTQEYAGTVFSFYQGYANGFIDALVAGDDGLYNLGGIIKSYASIQDLYQFFVPTVFIDPNSGLVNITVSFGWDDNQNWEVSFTSMYNPAVASLAASFESLMISTVINPAE